MLILDDLHWADTPTLLLLSHLARASQAPRTLVVVAFRDNEVDAAHPLGAVLADLRRDGLLDQIALRASTSRRWRRCTMA